MEIEGSEPNDSRTALEAEGGNRVRMLKFSDPLPELILKGEKTTTWRVGGSGEGVAVGNKLSLCDDSGQEFAKAEVVDVNDTIFDELNDDDKEGHEKFASDSEMYETYCGYYGEVTSKTNVKVIKFKLL